MQLKPSQSQPCCATGENDFWGVPAGPLDLDDQSIYSDNILIHIDAV